MNKSTNHAIVTEISEVELAEVTGGGFWSDLASTTVNIGGVDVNVAVAGLGLAAAACVGAGFVVAAGAIAVIDVAAGAIAVNGG